eukprot:TRINITY_DN1789_c0_g1_i1.p1 TRINITY_DN1789_c0_g1~~TRINITY_DN1789_c0_g1_i1.p1  ORF type:complete len:246 (+),score=56.14 TRINITY_DN1789_c0_g1_i1:267-1004(+)
MAETVYNFSFGSNMSKDKIEGARGIKCIESLPGILEDWKLSFQYRGIPFLEPCFATVQRCQGAEVHGICHLMTRDDFDNKLRATEGGMGVYPHGYVPVAVQVKLYDGRTVEAFVLEGQGNVIEDTYTLRPSERYLNLLRGSAGYGIDRKYFDWLNQQPAYQGNCCGKFTITCWLIFLILILFPFLLIAGLLRACGSRYFFAFMFNKILITTFHVFACCTCCSGASNEPQVPIFPKGSSDVFKNKA